MKVICAPDKFKESLTAADAARAMARGVMRADAKAEVDLCPIADGGEGTVDAMLAATNGAPRLTLVRGPLGEPVRAAWGMLGTHGGLTRTAVMEMAAASGLPLVPPGQRDPTRTSTFGTGQLIRAALDEGAERIILGIGGSATNDGGCGMAAALGVVFADSAGHPISAPTGGDLSSIHAIDTTRIDPRIQDTQFIVACDVDNPLSGPNGAAYIYGPQKGATPEQVQQLDRGLAHLGALFRSQLNRDVEKMPGAGAAGGIGGGLVAFLNATLRRGIDLVLDAVEFDRRVRGCTLCLTGEGRLDGQSLSGKACLGIAQRAKRHNVPTVALVGSVGANVERTLDAGLSAYHLIGEGLPLEESIRRAALLLESATERVMRSRI